MLYALGYKQTDENVIFADDSQPNKRTSLRGASDGNL